jgi:hypothetical protein
MWSESERENHLVSDRRKRKRKRERTRTCGIPRSESAASQ